MKSSSHVVILHSYIFFLRKLFSRSTIVCLFSFFSVDCDIIEGPSRISLSCPIRYGDVILNLHLKKLLPQLPEPLKIYHHHCNSRTRFKLPVKGHACKHLQVTHIFCLVREMIVSVLCFDICLVREIIIYCDFLL